MDFPTILKLLLDLGALGVVSGQAETLPQVVGGVLRWFRADYMATWDCMRQDALVGWLVIGANVLIVVEYIFVALFYSKGRRIVKDRKLRNLADSMIAIFILCAVCGYAAPTVGMWWPGHRLFIFFKAALIVVTAYFVFVSRGVQAIFELVESQQQVIDRLQEFKQFANHLPQLAWSARSNGDLYWYNDPWFEYTGTNLQEMLGWGWEKCHDPIELPRVKEVWRARLADGQAFTLEFPLRGRDGKFRRFLTRAVPVKDSTGKIIGWNGTNTDIEDSKQKEDAERAAAESNRSAMCEKMQKLEQCVAQIGGLHGTSQ